MIVHLYYLIISMMTEITMIINTMIAEVMTGNYTKCTCTCMSHVYHMMKIELLMSTCI